jgi:hypothetical protein
MHRDGRVDPGTLGGGPLTVNTYVAAVKSFLGFAHLGFTRFNAARPSSN